MNGHEGLICTALAKTFPPDGRGLKGVSLEVFPGESYALIGANGAGKTTLLNLCLGFLPPDSGDIRIGGHSLIQDPLWAKQTLAYVPEVTRLYGHLSALENLSFFEGLLGRQHDRLACLDLLSSLAFPESAADQPVGIYSKGMRQKVSLAIGLQKGAKVFLLDEPTSGLDPKTTGEVTQLLRKIAGEGKTVLFTTHNLNTIQRGANRVGILKDGRLILIPFI